MKKHLFLAVLAATVFGAVGHSAPGYAEPASVGRSAIVQYDDLDLGTKAGADKLKHRLWRAVVTVCGEAYEFDLEGKNDVNQCRRDAMQLASSQVDQIIAGVARTGPFRVTLHVR